MGWLSDVWDEVRTGGKAETKTFNSKPARTPARTSSASTYHPHGRSAGDPVTLPSTWSPANAGQSSQSASSSRSSYSAPTSSGRSGRGGSFDPATAAAVLGASSASAPDRTYSSYTTGLTGGSSTRSTSSYPASGTAHLAPRHQEDERKSRESVLAAQREQRARDFAGGGATHELSDEDYYSLTPRQRAAVDFNTNLVGAAMQDRDANDKYVAGSDPEYDAMLKRMFGDAGGSDIYAPTTLKLLDSIGYANKAADLDEYLYLGAAISDKDLSGLSAEGASKNQVMRPGDTSSRTANAKLLTENGAKAMAAALAGGRSLLDSVTGVDVRTFGDNSADAKQSLEFLFDTMAQRKPEQPITDTDLGVYFDTMQSRYGVTQDDYWNYAHDKLKEAEYESVLNPSASLGADPALEYKTPEEFRAEFGL